tara:strand:- start:31 stop:492 length:462 start_codon:yes stop_codon:yes gene_type:complete
MESTLIINKNNKHVMETSLISLLFLILNLLNENWKQIASLNMSNIFLIATILMSLCIKIFILNINIPNLKNYIDVNDTLAYAIEIINLNLFAGICLSSFHLLLPTIRIGYIPIYLFILGPLVFFAKNFIMPYNENLFSNTFNQFDNTKSYYEY